MWPDDVVGAFDQQLSQAPTGGDAAAPILVLWRLAPTSFPDAQRDADSCAFTVFPNSQNFLRGQHRRIKLISLRRWCSSRAISASVAIG